MNNRKLHKKVGYESLADYVNQQTGSNWDHNKAKARYERYLDKYKEIKRNYESNSDKKYGLSDKDIKNGVNSIEKKLNNDCPFFRRMDALFGGRQNISPTVRIEPNIVLLNNISDGDIINNNETSADKEDDGIKSSYDQGDNSSESSFELDDINVNNKEFNPDEEYNKVTLINKSLSSSNTVTPKYSKSTPNVNVAADISNSTIASTTRATASINTSNMNRGPSPTMQELVKKSIELKKSSGNYSNNRKTDFKFRDSIVEAKRLEVEASKEKYNRELERDKEKHEIAIKIKRKELSIEERKVTNETKKLKINFTLELLKLGQIPSEVKEITEAMFKDLDDPDMEE
eukprot:CAMPEP_0196767478 /NCGR_PEP_ID=MMETSP1095-20130614/41592_1 /TAXON_ID=96789 ORGANISM="Chromulina nebulosa, Strain UTEXLB2642" /NCGR_SAMPLE_ID=MMETSP1095 /ASSEMBLY_ACC=CAM_ASM_000446 /LENGTH=344 /DNA_ID=CAMNT_0042135849 /DNA_START=63 /DNA_END=1097 /DNA_ORIENTATION=+